MLANKKKIAFLEARRKKFEAQPNKTIFSLESNEEADRPRKK